MGYFLFLLVNAALFIRPAEVVPELYGLSIYNYLILACLAVTFPALLGQLQQRALETRPITLCVLGLLAAVVLSHVSHLELESAAEDGIEFLKIIVYYLLLVALVNTPQRLRVFLFWLAGCASLMTLICLLRYHEIVEVTLPSPPPAPGKSATPVDPKLAHAVYVKEEFWDAERGEIVEIRRLRGTGIFWDPNDLCLLLVLVIPLCLYGLTDQPSGAGRVLWLAPLALSGYALYLTQSRGGFLGFMAGLVAVLLARFGWRRSAPYVLAGIPIALMLFGNRMTNIVTGEGTGQQRIQIWSAGLDEFREAPLFGIGMNQYGIRVSHVAHNSFLHTFAELGMVGGTLFLGAFYFALATVHRIGTGEFRVGSYELWRLRPYLMGMLVGAVVCMLSLTLCYLIPVYTLLGVATVFAMVAVVPKLTPVIRLDLLAFRRVAVLGVGFMAATYLFVRVMVRW